MTPTDRATLLSALALAEGAQVAAADAVRTLRRVLDDGATTMLPLAEPDWLDWVPVGHAAQVLGVEKSTMAQRARRGVTAGIAEKRGGRWYVRLDRMPPARRRTP